MTVIAITREIGTLGMEVVREVADRLRLDVADHRIVERAIARRSGVPEEDVRAIFDGTAAGIRRWQTGRTALLRHAEIEILERAARGNVIVRGWGATIVLAAFPHIPCIRLTAPLGDRVRALQARRVGSSRAARREIRRSDIVHNGLAGDAREIAWQRPSHYALVLDRSRYERGYCANRIVELARNCHLLATPEAQSHLQDRLLELRMQFQFEHHFGSRCETLGLSVRCERGRATLLGGLTDTNMIAEILRLAHRTEGVVRVENRIAYVGFAA